MKWMDWLLDLLFPPRCAHCKEEGAFFCSSCWEKLEKKPIGHGFNPSKEAWQHLDGLIYGADYHHNPAIQAVVSQLKYKFNPQMAQYLSRLMEERLGQLAMLKGKPVVLIPIPLHPRRLRERGFNQSERLSQELQRQHSGNLRIELLLKRERYTQQQAKLKKEERQENLKEAFSLASPPDLARLNQGVCFLVDDVCTTGATLENAARLLKEAGIKKVYGLVAARAFR